jgi:uncharacterized protein YjbJ (UPF0337 family)
LEEEVIKDRVVGSGKQIKGAVKQVVGKVVGDTKLESEGKADAIEGKVQNTIGGFKDVLKGKSPYTHGGPIVLYEKNTDRRPSQHLRRQGHVSQNDSYHRRSYLRRCPRVEQRVHCD